MAMLKSCLLLFIIFSMGNTEVNVTRDVNGPDPVGLARRGCPATWTKLGLRCYKYFPHPTNWITAEGTRARDAVGTPLRDCIVKLVYNQSNGEMRRHRQKNCQSLGGNLASVRNNLENYFLMSLLPHSTHYWVGAHDAVQDGHWLWSDGSVFLYTHWRTGEPNNYQLPENCLEITSSSYWNDVPCSYSIPYICAKDV